MKITDVKCHVLLSPSMQNNATDSAQDDLVVEIATDTGLIGIGETDVNPWAAKALIESPGTHTMGLSLKQMLIGQDPMDVEAIWNRLYTGSCMNGRRGAGICAIGALDMALWDIRGKALRVPCWKLLGGGQQTAVTPYASLQPMGADLDSYTRSLVEWVTTAQLQGFTAAKLEASLFGPYAHNCLNAPEEALIKVISACREAVGSDFTLMVDVQYAWTNAREAARILRQLEQFDLFFIETPLQIDDLDGYAYLHDHCGIPIAAGEWQTTRFEFQELMDRGKVDVVQPDVGRVGGLTEAKRVSDMSLDRGRLMVPHCWKTGIGIAATLHLAVVSSHCRFIEFLPPSLCSSPLRKDLVVSSHSIVEGKLLAPTQPGLGIELNRDALLRFKAVADKAYSGV